MKAYYHSIETFGTVDGPGIRYVLFLAGCNLGCVFCHNPDTWPRGEKTITVAQVLKDLSMYRSFYELSGGGITVSGGEPLLQAEFVAELFRACKAERIHTVLDTSGYTSQQNIALVVPYVDQVLFCLKAVNPAVHQQLTVAGNDDIIANLRYVATVATVIVRYVIIPGINDFPSDIVALASLLSTLPKPVKVELLPYHTLGRHKWESLGLQYNLSAVPDAKPDDIHNAKKILEDTGIVVL
jgi:pyruvate formate lyase activating enzyme